MSLYKPDNIWWIDLTTASGERIRQSADTSNKLQAQQLHDHLKAASWRVERLGERREHTWDDAAAKWLDETSHKRTHHDDVLKLRWLKQYLGRQIADECDARRRGGDRGAQAVPRQCRDRQPPSGSHPRDPVTATICTCRSMTWLSRSWSTSAASIRSMSSLTRESRSAGPTPAAGGPP